MTMTTQTATGFIGIGHRISAVVNSPDAAVVALFSILGLLTSVYLMSYFPLSVEDAAFLAQYL